MSAEPSPHLPLPHTIRKGSVYLPTLIVGGIVLAVSITAVSLTRSTSAAARIQADTEIARSNARSAIEIARAITAQDNTWRTTRSNGTWFSNISMQTGSAQLQVVNPAGALNRSTYDPVVVTAIGTAGSATQRLSATLAPGKPTPITSLYTSLFADDGITSNNAKIYGFGQTIASNGLVLVVGLSGFVNPNVRSKTGIIGTTINGSTGTFSTALQTPSSDIFTEYSLYATSIPYTSIPTSGSTRRLERKLISPSSNPYGLASPHGIYIIDCGGGSLNIRDCRLVATLIVTNTSGVTVDDAINWTPPDPSQPILLVNGPLTLALDGNDLNENSTSGTFNPSSTPYPYPTGTGDNDITDAYPPTLDGLVYCTGNATLSNKNTIHAIHIGGSASITGTLTLTRTSRYDNTPPKGFYSTTLRLVSDSFHQP